MKKNLLLIVSALFVAVQLNAITINDADTIRHYPVNNYSGLNSLRARLANAHKLSLTNANTQTDPPISNLCHCSDAPSCQCSNSADQCNTDGDNLQQYTKDESAKAALANGSDTVGITFPYICYFKINTHVLTDKRQLEYLSYIARLAKERNMAVRVTGAADSATGTAGLNQRLSEKRADYIASQLIALGLSADLIQQQALGGIEEYTQIKNNRYCKIQLLPIIPSD